MSSYLKESKHPHTDKWEMAAWLDDHFGLHRYGVKFLDGKVFDVRDFDIQTRDSEVSNEDWEKFFPQPTQSTPEALPSQESSGVSEPSMSDLYSNIEQILAEWEAWQFSGGLEDAPPNPNTKAAIKNLIHKEVVKELQSLHNEQRAYVEHGANFNDVKTTWAIPLPTLDRRIAQLQPKEVKNEN